MKKIEVPTRAVQHGIFRKLVSRDAVRGLNWVDQHPYRVLLCFALFMGILGATKLWIDTPSEEFNWENRWWQIALNVVHGNGYVSCKPLYFPFCGPTNQVTAMREPLPVLIFAFVAQLTNESLMAAAALGVLVNILILFAIFCLVRELANHRTALLAGLLWAVYLAPLRLFYTVVTGDLFAALFLTASLIFFFRALKADGRREWIAAGVFIGLAILSRSGMIVIALVLSAGLAFRQCAFHSAFGPFRLRSLRPLALFMLAWSFVIAPWLARNYLVFNRPVIGTTLTGYYLYRQNAILATDQELRFVSGGEFLPVLQEMIANRPDLQGTENEAEMDQIYREEAFRIIRAEPIRYIQLSAYRFLMLWFNWRVNEVYDKQNSPIDQLILVQHGMFLATSTFALFRFFRQTWPLAVGLIAYILAYTAIIAHLPYVVPIMPLVVTLTALIFCSTRECMAVQTRFPSLIGLANSSVINRDK